MHIATNLYNYNFYITKRTFNWKQSEFVNPDCFKQFCNITG